MVDSNMKLISLADVQKLPNGTKVLVRCVGAEWHLEEKESWNVKQDDGLHYEEEDEEHVISFAYDYDYDSEDMEIICYVENCGCPCCMGDQAVYWQNISNNAFVDAKGEIAVTVKDQILKWKLHYCPNCGRKF